MHQRAPLEQAIEAMKAAAQRHGGGLQAAAVCEDSTGECEWAVALNADIDRTLATLGWTRDELVDAVSASPAAQELMQRANPA